MLIILHELLASKAKSNCSVGGAPFLAQNFRQNALEYYGIRGVAVGLFKNYVQNRPQIVKVGGEISNRLIIKCGVPQGSVLGPLLFLI